MLSYPSLHRLKYFRGGYAPQTGKIAAGIPAAAGRAGKILFHYNGILRYRRSLPRVGTAEQHHRRHP
jgi:hypothetical protein